MAAPTLAELMANSAGPVPVPKAEMTVTLVKGQHLLAQAKRLEQEIAELEEEGRSTDENGDPKGPPRKVGAGGKAARERVARLKAASAELEQVVGSLGDYQAILGLKGMTGGEWHRFKEANPARDGNKYDLVLAKGFVDSTAVFEALGTFVETWNGDAVVAGAWDDRIADQVCYSDRRDAITEVVMMHEQGMARAPKSSTGSSTTGTSGTD